MEPRRLQRVETALEIRPATPADHRATEEVARRAFWNLYGPGADAHYLVHRLREHRDFVPELDYVATSDGWVVGSIVYSRSRLVGEAGHRNALTFGPVGVLPEFQRRGVGSGLIEATFEAARSLGHPVVVIYGNPTNYVKFGFRGSKGFNITDARGRFPCALLVKELVASTWDGGPWTFVESEAFDLDAREVEAFDQGFEPAERGYHYRQEEFRILSRSFVE